MTHHQHRQRHPGHHQSQTEQEPPEHHVEGEGRHNARRKKVDEAMRRPSYTPQARPGQKSDTEPPLGFEIERPKRRKTA